MALTDLELVRCRREVSALIERRRPPPDVRGTVDLTYRISGQSIEIFEIRSRFVDPDAKYDSGIAKATYVRSRNRWRVFWMRRDRKWHGYAPKPEVNTLNAFLSLVELDEYACFWG